MTDRKIKIVFFDIDGTLRDFQSGMIPNQSKEGIRLLQQNGVMVFIATGRGKKMIEEERLLEDLEFDGFVTLNGNYCYDNNGTVLYENPIDEDQVDLMMKEIERDPFSCLFTEANDCYTTCINEEMLQVYEHIQTALPKVKSIHDVRKPIYQMMVCMKTAKKDEVEQLLTKCSFTRWSDDESWDVIKKGSSKVDGILHVLKKENLETMECAAVGDSYNDISMIQAAGLGIAVGNAKQAVQEAADYVSADICAGGILEVAQMIVNHNQKIKP